MAKKIEKIPASARETDEFAEGDRAFSNFIDVDDCPYASCGRDGADEIEGAKRLSWMAGWYDAKYKEMFPRLFDPLHPQYIDYEKIAKKAK